MSCVTEKSESELIAESRNGDLEAMAELFRRHHRSSIATARRMLPTEDCRDAVQSAYLSAFQNFKSFRGEASFKTWLTRIVLNHCLMILRKPASHRTISSLDQPDQDGQVHEIPGNFPSPEDLAARREIGRAVVDAAARLPKRLGEVFTRCALSEQPIPDVAVALGLTVAATKTRLFRARNLLRVKLRTVLAGRVTPHPSSRSGAVRAR